MGRGQRRGNERFIFAARFAEVLVTRRPAYSPARYSTFFQLLSGWNPVNCFACVAVCSPRSFS